MSSNIFSIKPKPSKIYVYLRVSTHAQTYKTNGIDEQNKICQKYIDEHRLNFCETEFFIDVGSSYNNKNTLFNLNKIARKISSQTNSLILVRDVSRLGRDTFQVFNLLRKIKNTNSHIISVEENLCYNYSKQMDRKFSHLIIDSEEHSDFKSIKSSNRINKIKLMGGYVGRIPYGTQIIKKNNIPFIYKNQNEINILKIIKKIFLKCKNVEKTTEYLNKKKLYYRNNVMWLSKQISYLLKKYFPNLLSNKNSDLIDKLLSKYEDCGNDKKCEDCDDKNITNDMNKLNITNDTDKSNLTKSKPKRKYTIK